MFKTIVKNKYKIIAKFEDWKSERWVHYSDYPEFKLKFDKQWHQDPLGIYLFPEGFKTEGQWHLKKHKFIVELLPSAKVLDLGTISTKEKAFEFLEKLGSIPKASDKAYDDWERFEKHFEEHKDEPKKMADLAWEWLTRLWGGVHEKKPALFNKKLSSLGYDAVFDDTESIHASETQLLVLNPTVLKVISREDRTGSGYKEVEASLKAIKEVLKGYDGETSEEASPKLKNEWGEWSLLGYINFAVRPKEEEVKTDEYRVPDKYISFKVRATNADKPRIKGLTPTQISVYGEGYAKGDKKESRSIRMYLGHVGPRAEHVDKPFSVEQVNVFTKEVMDKLWK